MRIENFKPIVSFLADFLGTDSEIILSDVIKKEVICVKNPHDTNIKIGSSIRSIEQEIMNKERFKNESSIINYRGFSSDHRKLRSATFFIKNNNDELIGLLSINSLVGQLIELRDVLNSLISGTNKVKKNQDEFYDTFDTSFDKVMINTIQEAINQYDIPPDRLSHEEKVELIQTLDDKGTFLIKGSIQELAKTLQTTETSIYRYINALR